MSANKTRFSDKVRKMDFDKLEEVRQKQYKVAVAKVIKGFEEDPVNAEKQLDKLILGLDRLTADAVKVAESTPHEAVRKASKIEKGIIADVTSFVLENNGNVINLDQHTDREDKDFFMRIEWDLTGFTIPKVKIVDIKNYKS